MLEDVALMELRDGRFPTAIATLEQARGAYTNRDDIIRCVLEECDALIKFGKPNRALDLTRRVYGSYRNRLHCSSSAKWKAISASRLPQHRRRTNKVLSNNAALAFLDELEQLADLLARFDFLPHRIDRLTGVQFRSV